MKIASADRMTERVGMGEEILNERKRTHLKTLFIILAAALILAFAYLAVPKERSIERRVDATLVQNGSPAERRQTALTISGASKSSLFGGDSFAGKVEETACR